MRLADALGADIIHKDALALMTGWQQRPSAQVQAAIAERMNTARWVLEGGPSILAPHVLAKSDLVIWLDIPAPLRVWRIIWRSLQYAGRVRPEHPPGNRDWPGLRQTRFAWRALTRGEASSQTIYSALDDTGVPVLRLKSVADVATALDRLS